MRVTATTRMHVDVHELRSTIRVELQGLDVEPGLFARLADRSIPRCFPRIDVPAGLQPESEPPVTEEYHAALPHHERRAGDVHRVGILVERRCEAIEQLDESSGHPALAVVGGFVPDHLRAHHRPEILHLAVRQRQHDVEGTADWARAMI